MRFLDILVAFRLNFGQKVSFNLVEKAFARQQFALLATNIAFYDILARACAQIKIFRSSLRQVSREFKQIATAGADTAAGSNFPQNVTLRMCVDCIKP